MSDVTQFLQQIDGGDPSAAEKLLPLVYDELRKLAAARMAAERADHTLQATALVHEAYLRLVDNERAQHWDSRGHFFAAAAEAMRRILIESARRNSVRQNAANRAVLTRGLNSIAESGCDADLLLDLDEGLTRLAQEDSVAAELVKLRLFAGMSVAEAGEMLGMGRTKAYDNWEFARSWFALHCDAPAE